MKKQSGERIGERIVAFALLCLILVTVRVSSPLPGWWLPLVTVVVFGIMLYLVGLPLIKIGVSTRDIVLAAITLGLVTVALFSDRPLPVWVVGLNLLWAVGVIGSILVSRRWSRQSMAIALFAVLLIGFSFA